MRGARPYSVDIGDRARESELENERARELDITRARLHYNMRVRHHEITRAQKRERMLAWAGLTRALRALVGGLACESRRVREYESKRVRDSKTVRK